MPQTFLCSRSVRKPSHLLPHLPQPPILPPGGVTAPGGLPLFTWLVSDVRMAVPSESPAPWEPGIDWLSTQLVSTLPSWAPVISSHLLTPYLPAVTGCPSAAFENWRHMSSEVYSSVQPVRPAQNQFLAAQLPVLQVSFSAPD